MLIKTFKSLDRDFILAEQQTMLTNIVGYSEQITNTIKGDAPSRMLGNAYLVLEENYGSGGALGFLITFNLLRRWMEKHNDATWLDAQYERVNAMGSEAAGKYTMSFLEDPSIEIRRLSELLTGNSLLRGFINYGEIILKKFSVGAYLLIGLLLLSEHFDEKTVTIAE